MSGANSGAAGVSAGGSNRRAIWGALLLIAACWLTALTTTTAIADAKAPLKVRVEPGQIKHRASVVRKPGAVLFVVKLNGKRITDRFGQTDGGNRRVHLGRQDGLRHGSNKLRAKVLRPNGRTVVRSDRFRVAKRKPLPAAGRDLEVLSGDRVGLNGGRARKAPGRSARLSHRWRLLKSPRGSDAGLTSARSETPSLKTDVHGTYLVEQRVRQRGSGVRLDRVEIEAHDSAANAGGVLLGALPPEGGDRGPGIRIYAGPDSAIYRTTGGERQFVLLLFDRQTLELRNVAWVDAQQPARGIDAAIDAAEAKLDPGSDLLVAIQGTAPAGAGLKLSRAISDALGVSFRSPLAPGDPVMGVGVPGSGSAGCGHQVADWGRCAGKLSIGDNSGRGRMLGALSRDSSGNYTFLPIHKPAFGVQRVGFNTSAPGTTATRNVFTIAGESYESEEVTGPGGFHVALLDGSSLQPVAPGGAPTPSANGTWTFRTGSNDGATALDQMEAMQQLIDSAAAAIPTPVQPDPLDLNNIVSSKPPSESIVIVVQSIGRAIRTGGAAPPGEDDRRFELGNSLAEQFGASRSIFNIDGAITRDGGPEKADGGYAFVGSSLYAQRGGTYQGRTKVSAAESEADGPGVRLGSGGEIVKPPATVSGLLRRDTFWQFEPTGSSGDALDPDGGGGFTSPLADAALEIAVDGNPGLEPTEFPHAGEPDWTEALQFAAKELAVGYDPATACYRPPEGMADIRSSYCGGPRDFTWSSLIPALDRIGYPAGASFSEATWVEMKDQLAIEFPKIDRLNGAAAQAQALFVDSNEAKALIDVKAIVDAIDEAVDAEAEENKPKPQPSSLSIVGDLFTAIGGFVGIAEVAAPVGAGIAGAGGLLLLIEDFTNKEGGEPSSGPPISGYTGDVIERSLISTLEGSGEGLAVARDRIAADAGRLELFIERSSDSSPGDASVRRAIAANVEIGVQRHAFRMLLPTAFELREVKGNRSNSPVDIPNFKCDRIVNRKDFFTVIPRPSFYYDILAPADDPVARRRAMLLLRPDQPDRPPAPRNNSYQVPEKLMDPLFEPVVLEDGAPVLSAPGKTALGESSDHFYNRTFNGFHSPVPRVFSC